jgi:hypothetical protein
MSANARESDQVRADVVAYKTMLRDLIDRRPSGTRQRLADAIGKNRSFITQITNPAYSVPVPAQHIPVILEICHITGDERVAFLDAYHAAHPRRPVMVQGGRRFRHVAIDLPDFGDAAKNRRFDAMLKTMMQNLTALADEMGDKENR